MGSPSRPARKPTVAPGACPWSLASEALRRYHDEEWGRPVRDDRVLFEYLVLSGAQAGLNWAAILSRRGGYRKAFAGFDPAKVARFTPARVERLLADPGIIRNRAKVASAIANAKAWLAVRREFGSFAAFAWAFVGGRPLDRRWKRAGDVPAVIPEAEALSRELRKRGFAFAGPTITYAFMQMAGMVNDHLEGCPARR